MTTSISPSFNYIRPINILNDGTIYRNGIENTDGTLASLSQPKTAAKAPTWQVVRHDRSAVVQCHNLASARAIAEGRAPNKTTQKPVSTVSVTAYVSPTGQYYVMHGNQRMDVANASTARHYVKHGVAISTMLAASLSSLNQ